MKGSQKLIPLRGIILWIVFVEIIMILLVVLFKFMLMDRVSGLRLDNPILASLFIIAPILSLLYLRMLNWKNKSVNLFGELRLVTLMIPHISKGKLLIRYLLVRISIFLLTIAAINPKIGSKIAQGKSEGIDVMVCLDLSNSMLAEDQKPSRLVNAKRTLERLFNQMRGHRVGLIVFAGDAYVQLPITTDYGAAKMFLSTVDPDQMPVQGTSVGKALDLALQSFDFEKRRDGKAIILITDGENHEDDAVSAAQRASDNKIPVYVVGMGTLQGGPIPIMEGSKRVDYKRDKDGTVVVSTPDFNEMNNIAQATSARFFQAQTSPNFVDELLASLEKQTKSQVDSVVYTDYEDRFQLFTAIALLLLIIEFILSEKKSRWIEKSNWFYEEV